MINLESKVDASASSLSERLQFDQEDYAEKTFAGRNFSDAFKFIKIDKEPQAMPPVVKWFRESASTQLEKANLFNRFFASVFLCEQSLVPCSRTECLVEPMLCTAEEVSDNFSSLKIKKATGLDEIPKIFLKNCSELLCVSLNLLLGKILNKGVFLTEWKTSFVCPLYKERDRSSAEQNWPISLLSNVSNVFGRIAFNRIHESTQHLLFDNQYGFRKKRSTSVQLLWRMIDKMYQFYDQRDPCCKMAYFDFAKAFYEVSHRKLIQKLQTFPIITV